MLAMTDSSRSPAVFCAKFFQKDSPTNRPALCCKRMATRAVLAVSHRTAVGRSLCVHPLPDGAARGARLSGHRSSHDRQQAHELPLARNRYSLHFATLAGRRSHVKPQWVSQTELPLAVQAKARKQVANVVSSGRLSVHYFFSYNLACTQNLECGEKWKSNGRDASSVRTWRLLDPLKLAVAPR